MPFPEPKAKADGKVKAAGKVKADDKPKADDDAGKAEATDAKDG